MISTNYFVFSFAADICSLVIIIIGLVLTRFWGDMIGKMGKITVCALLIQMVEVLSNMAGLYWKGSKIGRAHV